jgi:hypothetical protein
MGYQENPESVAIEYDRKTLGLKMKIQRAVISVFCEGDTHDEKRVKKWIMDNSQDFREIFERRMINEADFLERCEHSPNQIVNEIVDQLKLAHSFPTTLAEDDLVNN